MCVLAVRSRAQIGHSKLKKEIKTMVWQILVFLMWTVKSNQVLKVLAIDINSHVPKRFDDHEVTRPVNKHLSLSSLTPVPQLENIVTFFLNDRIFQKKKFL